MSKTKIEWTDRVWNPVTGCTKVSQGCKNCYAERWAKRFFGERKFTDVQTHLRRLEAPLTWKSPSKAFVNSMSDLFHEEVPFEFIAAVYAQIIRTPQHTYQILTKRPERAVKFYAWLKSEKLIKERTDLPTNVWLGVSVEDQATADERIPVLLETPAALRFVSYEPALGQVDLSRYLNPQTSYVPDPAGSAGLHTLIPGIDWLICGGESGPRARPMHPHWARSARDQCRAARVPFFFKQWGEWKPVNPWGSPDWCSDIYGQVSILTADGTEWNDGYMPEITVAPSAWEMQHLGKRRAGRLLDGREWNEFPVTRT